MQRIGALASCLALATWACGSAERGAADEPLGDAGAPVTGGSPAEAGGVASQSDGGTAGQGGAGNAGGHEPPVGGAQADGGSYTRGGAGGTPGSGGGGRASGGGAPIAGGATSPGGSPTSGRAGAEGGVETGGTTASGEGGVSASLGGSGVGGVPGTCSRDSGACSAPQVRYSEVELGIPVTDYGWEADTDPFPMAIAGMPSGGSRLAWLGTDGQVYVATLDCDDQLVGTPFSFPAEDLQDIYADDDGGVVMLTRNAENGGADNCGTGSICGGTSSPCQNTWLVRFDATGAVTWEAQVTNLTSTLGGYDDGAIFTWKQYQHHGRIAFDGSNYAAYFAAAISVYRNGSSGCVDIHEGDRMQVVSSSGQVLALHNSFEWGCSHSWTTRIIWDAANDAFVMTCATDADNCAIKRPDTGALLFQATCSGEFFNGDLVGASDGGYWSAWSDTGSIRLNHFSYSNAKGTAIDNAGSAQHPHLVPYGPSHMILAWGSGSAMVAQVRSSDATGAAVGQEFAINVADHDFGALKPYADGSVAYAAKGSASTSIQVARVMLCN